MHQFSVSPCDDEIRAVFCEVVFLKIEKVQKIGRSENLKKSIYDFLVVEENILPLEKIGTSTFRQRGPDPDKISKYQK
jgi:hypothetical protein